MMSHGALWQADSIERTAQICPPSHSDEERHIARAGPAAPFQAPIAQQRQVRFRSASAAHCTDLLSAKENLVFCNVRQCQENCGKLLHWLTTDRGAAFARYPAITRLAVSSSSFLRHSPPSCDRYKNQTEHPCRRFRAGSWKSICRILGDRECVRPRKIERSQGAGVAAVVPARCRSDAGKRTGKRSRLALWRISRDSKFAAKQIETYCARARRS